MSDDVKFQSKEARINSEDKSDSSDNMDTLNPTPRPSVNDTVDSVVDFLMQYKKKAVNEEFAEHAITFFVKKLTGKPDLDILMDAVSTNGVEGLGCVPVSRPADGLMKVLSGKEEEGQKKLTSQYQTNVSARLWRWPDITKKDLKHLPHCQFPDEPNRKQVCINPHHFIRIVADVSDPSGRVEAALSRNYAVFRDSDLAKTYYLKCPMCTETFPGDQPLSRHIKEVHPGIPHHPCGVLDCSETFITAQEKLAHRDEKHETKPFKCREEICISGKRQKQNSAFENLTRLLQHIRSVHDEKVKCPVCGHSFSGLELVRHVRNHTAFKPYKCQLEGCTRAFQTEFNLKNHYIAHSDDRPYKCENCPATFKFLPSLTLHQRKENCYKCGYKFVDNIHSDEHFRKHHEDFRLYEKMRHRVTKLFSNLAYKTPAEQIDDFKKIYQLSEALTKYHVLRQKLYFGVLVPKTVDNVREHIGDPKNIWYGYLGKYSAGTRSHHLSKYHFEGRTASSVTKLHRLSEFKFIHISDYWIADHGADDLVREEAKKILQLFLFTLRNERKDIFFQKLELMPIMDLTQAELDEMLEQIEASEGDLFSIPGFEIKFTKEHPFSKFEGQENFYTCPYKCTEEILSMSLLIRHTAACSKRPVGQSLQSVSEQILCLKTIDKKKILDLLHGEKSSNEYICYSILATKHTFKAREELSDFIKNKDNHYQIYDGQSSYGVVSRYHFQEGVASTLKNLASDKNSLFHVREFNCATSEEMYKLETFLQVNESLWGKLQKKRETLAISSFVLYDISQKFTLEEWLQVLDYSQKLNALIDPLPDFIHATRVDVFKKLAVPKKKSPAKQSTSIKEDESNDDFEEDEDDEDVAVYTEEQLNAEYELFDSIIEHGEFNINDAEVEIDERVSSDNTRNLSETV